MMGEDKENVIGMLHWLACDKCQHYHEDVGCKAKTDFCLENLDCKPGFALIHCGLFDPDPSPTHETGFEESLRRGIADLKAGRVEEAQKVFDEIEADFEERVSQLESKYIPPTPSDGIQDLNYKCQPCIECDGLGHHWSEYFINDRNSPDHPAAQSGLKVWQQCKHCPAWRDIKVYLQEPDPSPTHKTGGTDNREKDKPMSLTDLRPGNPGP